MQELSLEKQKLLMLEILLDFDKVCRIMAFDIHLPMVLF